MDKQAELLEAPQMRKGIKYGEIKIVKCKWKAAISNFALRQPGAISRSLTLDTALNIARIILLLFQKRSPLTTDPSKKRDQIMRAFLKTHHILGECLRDPQTSCEFLLP